MWRSTVALLCLCPLQATQAAECADGVCKQEEKDPTSMLQLGRVGASAGGAKVMNATQRAGFSEPYRASEGDLALLEANSSGSALIIDEDGRLNTYYLMGKQGAAPIINGGRTVKYVPPYRYYLMRRPTSDFSNAANFYKPNFVGKTFSVDIDFKHNGPGCGCNLNFYLVDMPWHSPGKDGDYYCDAQCFDGMGCCVEFDMNEGNKEVQQVTNHACTGRGSYPGHGDWNCNKWGDPELKTHRRDFGPGGGHTIDSNRPFTWSQRFDANGGNFIFTTTMSQDGRQMVLRMGPGNAQLNSMLRELQKGLAFVTGYWFDPHMNWMDEESCGKGEEHCNRNPAYISNWRITSNSGVVPTPAYVPPPSQPFSPQPPQPAAGGRGKCCFSGPCSGCSEDPGNYCNKGAGRCGSCGGQWCSGQAEAVPEAPAVPAAGGAPAAAPAAGGAMCDPRARPAQRCPGGAPCPQCGQAACPCLASAAPYNPYSGWAPPRRRTSAPTVPASGGAMCNPYSIPQQQCPGRRPCPRCGKTTCPCR